MTDNVNNPSHYAEGFSNGAEVIDITENLNFNRGNAVKYLARAGKKEGSDELQDLQKAQFYVNREVERESARRAAEAGKAVFDDMIKASLDAIMGWPTPPFAPFGTTDTGAKVFAAPVGYTDPIPSPEDLIPHHTSEARGPRSWEAGDDEPTDAKYVIDGEGDRFRYEGSDQWTFQASNGKWGTKGIFRWSEVTDLGTVTEDLEHSEAEDLTIPEIKYGDRVRISLTATTANGGFVSPKAQGATGTVFNGIDSQGDVGVQVDTVDTLGLKQWISSEHLDKIVDTEEPIEPAPKFKVGDRVVIADEPELQGGGYVDPDAGGRLGTVASEKNPVGNYRVDPIDGLPHSQAIGEGSLTKALPSQEFKVGELVKVTGEFVTSCGHAAYPDQIGGVGATVKVARNVFPGLTNAYDRNNVEVKEVGGFGSQWVDPASLTRVVDLPDEAEVEDLTIARRDEIKVGDEVIIIGTHAHNHDDGAVGEVTRVGSGDMLDVKVGDHTQLLVRAEIKRVFETLDEVPFFLKVQDTDGDTWKVDDDGDVFISYTSDYPDDEEFESWDGSGTSDYAPFVEVK